MVKKLNTHQFFSSKNDGGATAQALGEKNETLTSSLVARTTVAPLSLMRKASRSGVAAGGSGTAVLPDIQQAQVITTWARPVPDTRQNFWLVQFASFRPAGWKLEF